MNEEWTFKLHKIRCLFVIWTVEELRKKRQYLIRWRFRHSRFWHFFIGWVDLDALLLECSAARLLGPHNWWRFKYYCPWNVGKPSDISSTTVLTFQVLLSLKCRKQLRYFKYYCPDISSTTVLEMPETTPIFQVLLSLKYRKPLQHFKFCCPGNVGNRSNILIATVLEMPETTPTKRHIPRDIYIVRNIFAKKKKSNFAPNWWVTVWGV